MQLKIVAYGCQSEPEHCAIMLNIIGATTWLIDRHQVDMKHLLKSTRFKSLE